MSTGRYREWLEVCAELEAAHNAIVSATFPDGSVDLSVAQRNVLDAAKRRLDIALAKQAVLARDQT